MTNFTLVARDALGRERGEGGDVFAVWAEGRTDQVRVKSGRISAGINPGQRACIDIAWKLNLVLETGFMDHILCIPADFLLAMCAN